MSSCTPCAAAFRDVAEHADDGGLGYARSLRDERDARAPSHSVIILSMQRRYAMVLLQILSIAAGRDGTERQHCALVAFAFSRWSRAQSHGHMVSVLQLYVTAVGKA